MAQRTPYSDGPNGGSAPSDPRRALIDSRGSGDETTNPESVPFVWQHDKRLLLLDEEQRGWVLAELKFNPANCRYTEVRRALYRWPREAVGAVLSRALASGVDATEDAADRLNAWLNKYHGFSLWWDRKPRTSAETSDQVPS